MTEHKAGREDSGFRIRAVGPLRFVRWTKESLVSALTFGKPATKKGWFTAEANTAPLAICLAALKAVFDDKP